MILLRPQILRSPGLRGIDCILAIDAGIGNADITFFNGETTEPAGPPDTDAVDPGYHYVGATGP